MSIYLYKVYNKGSITVFMCVAPESFLFNLSNIAQKASLQASLETKDFTRKPF